MKDPFAYYIKEGFAKMFVWQAPDTTRKISGLIANSPLASVRIGVPGTNTLLIGGVPYNTNGPEFFIEYGTFVKDEFEANIARAVWRKENVLIENDFKELAKDLVEA